MKILQRLGSQWLDGASLAANPRFDRFVGPVAILLTIAISQLLLSLHFQVVGPFPLMVIFVIYSALRGGTKSGLASAVMSCFYLAHYLHHVGQFIQDSGVASARVASWGITLPVIAVMVGSLKKRHVDKAASVSGDRYFKELTDTIEQIVWIAAPDGSSVYYNSRWFEYSGLKMSETEGWRWAQAIHPDDQAQAVEIWASAMKSGDRYEIEYRLRRADGTFRWHLGRARPVRGSHGRITKWLGTATDIHDQKVAERSAIESRQRVDAVVANASVILFCLDKNGIYTYAEGSALEYIGVKPGDRVGRSAFEINKSNPKVMDALHRAFKGERVSFLTEVNGHWFECLFNPTFDSSGAVSGIMGTAFNVNERVQAEQAVKAAQLKLKAIINQAPVVIWSINKEGRYTLREGKALELIESMPGEMVGSSAFELFKDFPSKVEHLQRALQGETLELEYKVGDRFFSDHLSPSRDPDGSITGAGGISIDITARKLAEMARADYEMREASARETSRVKSEFLAKMSHEIRTPINAVIGMTGLLLDTPLTRSQREYGETIRQSADGLLGLVNDVLDFSKAEAGKMTLEKIDFELEQLIREIERTLSFSVTKKGLKLFRSISPELPRFLKGDPTRLRQVLLNLLNNAVKFTPFGHVTFEAELEQDAEGTPRVRFEISDTGIGISPEAMGRMFDAFSQADSSTTRRFGGTGLGLSICKHLVRLMGGDIGVESDEGRGSTFWFTIPFQMGVEPQPSDSHDAVRDKAARQPLRVLVAEDNSINQVIAVKMLEQMGHSVVAVENGQMAIDAIRASYFDIVLMDCQMPELDGYQATRVIRESLGPEHSRIPIVAMTANAMPTDRDKCLEAGMDDYVSKPVKAEDLQTILEKNLR